MCEYLFCEAMITLIIVIVVAVVTILMTLEVLFSDFVEKLEMFSRLIFIVLTHIRHLYNKLNV